MKNTILLFSFLFFTHFLISQDGDSIVWTIEKHMEFKRISNVDLSQDGKLVAYEVVEPIMEGEKSEYLSHIWVASADGSFNVQYTRGDKSNTNPSFSPDGQWLAFHSERGEKRQLYVMRVMGGEAEAITSEKKAIGAFKWSPDGKSIAFLKADDQTEEEEKRKKEKRDVIEVDKNFKYNHLYTIKLDDRKIQRLTNGKFHVTSFDWAPDGSKIVFAHKPDPKINTNRIESDISWVESDSSKVNALVDRPGPDHSPHFSPDGQKIAFQSNGGSPQPIGLSDVYVVSLDDKKIEPLIHTPDRTANILDWSSDGSQIYITEPFRTSRVALSIPSDPNTKETYQILTHLDGNSTRVDISGESMAYVFESMDQAPELYISPIDGSAKKMLSQVNSDVVIPSMGKTEVITWKSKDGMEIEGLLTYPVGYNEGDKVPLVLQIHGGPAGVFTKSFTGSPSIYMTQYFAEEGIAVLRPNPRGSTGYGKEFRYANFKDWGFGDYEDVMSGVDKVIEMGVANPNKMTVMGWSYGGYLTSFLVTRTDRFKAASMGAGLPNLVSMTTTTDIPDYLVGHMGAEVWDDYDTYEKHSAMYRIKNVKTPTQVIHGANDLRVPFTQGQEFYVALKRRGIPTEMLVLPRTPHGPREPGLLMEVSPRIMNWFSKHLQVRP